MSPYITYYANQAGRGTVDRYSDFGRVFVGSPYQRGHGIGAFLGGLFRRILPYLGSAARAPGKEALNAGINVVGDVVTNGKPLKCVGIPGSRQDSITNTNACSPSAIRHKGDAPPPTSTPLEIVRSSDRAASLASGLSCDTCSVIHLSLFFWDCSYPHTPPDPLRSRSSPFQHFLVLRAGSEEHFFVNRAGSIAALAVPPHHQRGPAPAVRQCRINHAERHRHLIRSAHLEYFSGSSSSKPRSGIFNLFLFDPSGINHVQGVIIFCGGSFPLTGFFLGLFLDFGRALYPSARPSGVPMVTYTYGDGIAVSCSARQLDSGIPGCRPGVLLATSLAYLVCPDGAAHRIRLLIDPGSEISLIGDQIVRRLGLTRSKTSLLISGIGNSASGPALGKVPLTIQSTHSSFQLRVTAYALSQLTTSLPTFTPGQLKWDHLEGLQLADPSFLAPAPIDVLLGADVYGQLILPEVITHDPGSPSAQLTRLGWVIFGPTESVALAHTATAHLAVSNEDLDGLLTRFWVQEEVPETSEVQLTDEEAQCEEHFRRTHTRDCSGRYIVRLPLKAPPSVLGDSRASALACLHQLLRKFSRDEEYHQLYTDFLKEYEALGHMRRVSGQHTQTAHRQRLGECTALGTTLAHEAPASGGLRVPNSSYSAQAVTSPEYFFPHHGVVRTSSETTKLRVVFNGSHKTSSGQTLNEIMHTGAKLQRDIADILWADANGDVTTYQLTTVTYGTRSAPFLSIRVLNQLVEDEGSNYPLAVEPLTKGRYVDDICGGADSEEELLKTAHHVTQLCQSGGFPLAKWHSNSAGLLSTLRLDSTSHDQKVIEDSITKILGVSWHPGTDSFTFSIARPETNSISKRIILSETAQLFDPLGFLAPVVVRAKILLQALWIEKLGWDDPVSPTTAHRWRQFRDELNQLSDVTVPRWLGLLKGFDVEVHGFSDASQVAMAAVIYLKVPHLPGNGITLVCSKTKVAPLKRLTIPRLELTAALLLAKLIRYVQDQLNLRAAPTYLWTDSSVTLTWISSHPSRWKEFVRNRVALIQELTQPSHWRLVPGKENPADCASRGLTAQQLAAHKLWWTGPPWLQQDSLSWPTHVLERDLNVDLEEKPGQIYYGAAQQIAIWDLIDRFSSFNRLLRITAICSRFIARLRRVPNTSLHYALTLSELEDARLLWIKLTQTAHFREELRIISRREKFTRSHPLTKLTPFIDRQGILRVGGRLRFAQLDPESKNQAIIPKESQLARLLISQAHLRTLHGGTQLTLRQLRTAYCILGGRAPVRSFILKCVKCARQRGIRAQQLMGQLPPAPLTPARAFLNTGVDYAGPISLRSWKGRGHKSYKGWLAIFVCMTTSAVHLEVVSDYSADAFLAAYRRFSSRRGIAHTLFSDCGTTFLGADRELRRLFLAGSSESRQLAQLLIQDGTQWSFNPPSAPHFGGKWEAAVKSVKYHLTRTIGEDLLTFEELTTLLAQVEAVLNSRPLEPLTDDPDDCSALTPGHFLIGQAPTTLPEPSLENLNISRLSRWQLIQRKLQGFWKRWCTGYLQRLQAISKCTNVKDLEPHLRATTRQLIGLHLDFVNPDGFTTRHDQRGPP
ncbi:uncharacterized protein LOC135163937 [Diachasmimorpha longicaudata]|uniref:uncharacterized protein LOC135163937 n=1 Tax=Diachasmimorpha longicaudata TaxID=58733 RepID=UPI0030B877D0